MEIYQFKECNAVYAENQPEYQKLPCHKTREGVVTACWKMSLRERLKALFTGKVYLQLLTFNDPLQPQILTVDKPISLIKKNLK